MITTSTSAAAVDVRTSFLAWLAGVEAGREDDYLTYREYYDGDHDTQLTERMARYLQVKSSTEFRSNYCPIVVDALVERLAITGLQCEGQAQTLWDWWTKGRLDGLQGILHTATVRDGDAYIIVEWSEDEQRPVFFFESAYASGEGVKVVYDDATNKPKLAVKRWRIKSGEGAGYVRRMNVYYPDRVEKFVSDDKQDSGKWLQFSEEGQPWPQPWVDKLGDPLGLPIIHFKNKDQGYNYGQSELKDVVPLQNALNKTIIDMLAAADTTGFRIYYMIGDDPSDVSVSPGSWVYSVRPSSGQDSASIGYFPGEDLGNLISLKDSFAIEIARVSRTPVSYFQISGQRAAEGTLKQEESGLVGRAKNRQIGFGNSWEDAFAVARKLWNTFGSEGELDPTATISAVWRDPETRNEKVLLETLEKKQALGVPKEQLWSEMGYSAEQIVKMKAMAEAEALTDASLGESLVAAFERSPAAAASSESTRSARSD